MVSLFQSTLLLLALTLTTTTAFAPTTNNASRTLHSSTLHLLGNRERKPAKNHEEDMELTVAEIMKYAAKMDQDNVVDDDDDDGVTVGNLISEPNVEDVKSGGNPLKELGKKIKGKFNKSN